MLEPLNREFLEQPDAFERRLLERWEQEDLLHRTLQVRRDAEPFVFYEGPPTANGQPGIHHVLSRTLKDCVCRYHTMRGKRVLRKAGWDTHGLPVELEVEKQLGISGKPEIEKLGIGEFNHACRESVFTYKEEWERISQRIGFLLDYADPYVTFHSDYVESVWFLLSRYAANGLLYRGYKVLPWCGRCGTGLSSHEVGQGYADIDDPSVWVSFPLREPEGGFAPALAEAGVTPGTALVAWTTTPWTLPSNMAACVHPDFEYVVVERGDQRFVLLPSKVAEVFGEEGWRSIGRVKGGDLGGLSYEPLFDLPNLVEIRPGERVHVVVVDDFVDAEEGTGVVHMAPYGADDFRIAQRDGIRVGLAVGEESRLLVDVGDETAGTLFREANKGLARQLKERGRLLRHTQYRHSYPHCWRCDTPLIYFPAPAWFLRTTAYKDRMVEANARIQWSPPEIGAGRFGEWLENNVDWALSRDRFWGTPLPVWMCDADEDHWECLGSFAELAERAGGLADDFDPHRPTVDAVRYACRAPECSGTMQRVPQVIDVWFDSGSMPFAQYHWPFENRELVAEQFPADFICEGLDQTRGWFYTLHSIATFLTQVDEELWDKGAPGVPPPPAPAPERNFGGAFRSILVNGLLLDSQGRKMSKRLGNRVDPWEAVREHGVDSIRWGLLAGGAAHLSRRYSDDGIAEVRRRVLGTLGASYDFLALYARTEGWTPDAPRPALGKRPPLDRWILSRTVAALTECEEAWDELQPNLVLRALERLIVDELSNWYIRRSRRRFWGDEGADSQAAAFATLHEVLHAVVRMAAPMIPFLTDAIWRQLVPASGSVHLELYPQRGVDLPSSEQVELRDAMDPILRASRLGRAVRERTQLRVRQPLGRLVVHVAGEAKLSGSPRDYEDLLREELNVKEVEWIDGVPDFLQVRAKPNYPRLGKRAGKDMKALARAIAELDRTVLFALQGGESTEVRIDDRSYVLAGDDVVLETVSVEGLEAATDGSVTIGLSTEITPALLREGTARELVNRIQTQRKESGLDVSDRIRLRVSGDDGLHAVIQEFGSWIAEEVLAPEGVEWIESSGKEFREWSLNDDCRAWVALERRAAPVA